MDKEVLEKRLVDLEKMKENHVQDVQELSFVIDGLKKQIKAFS